MIPDEVDEFGQEVARRVRQVLGDGLVGTYFVGSVALGGYVPGESDIDITAVCEDEVDRADMGALADALLAVRCPARGLEFVLYRRGVLAEAPLGSDFEVCVSGGPRMSRLVNLESSEQPGFWFVLDRAIAHRQGIAICGPPPHELFPEPTRTTLLDAMVDSMRWHRANERIGFYSVLNASRAWRFAVDDVLGSKLEGAAWARTRWSKPWLIDAAVELRHGRPADLDDRELHAYLDGVERMLVDAERISER